MTVESKESGKKYYRIVQIEGKITWRVEELWDGGVVRQPYGSKHAAITAEEKIARQDGFFDILTLQEVAGEEVIPVNAFDKDAKGNWICRKPCSITIDNTAVVCTPGMEFEKGILYLGIDVAQWLNDNYAASQRV